jgi:hypothetical protein
VPESVSGLHRGASGAPSPTAAGRPAAPAPPPLLFPVVCVNNDGYVVERYLSPVWNASYNFVPRWAYAQVAEAMCNGHGRYKARSGMNRPGRRESLRRARAPPAWPHQVASRRTRPSHTAPGWAPHPR